MNIPDDSWWHHRETLQDFAQEFEGSARLRLKESRVWSLTRPMRTFATTIGRVIYIPAEWTAETVRKVIPHEAAGHIRQFRWAGLGIHANLGIFPMFLVYAWGGIFPILLAWGRYRCELHAETQSWRYHLKQGLWASQEAEKRAEWFVRVVCGPAYGWAWPKPWGLWGFRRRVRKVIKEMGRG